MLSEQQRRRMMRYGAQRQQYLAARATTLRTRDSMEEEGPRAAGMSRGLFGVLIVLPLALTVVAGALDIMAVIAGTTSTSVAAGYLMLAAAVAGLVAVAAGTVVWTALDASDPARRLSAWHLAATATLTIAALMTWATRRSDLGEPSLLALALAMTSAALAMLTGWIAGEVLARLDPAIFVINWDEREPSVAVPAPFEDDLVPAAATHQVARA